MKKVVQTHSEEETKDIAKKLGSILTRPIVITLEGDLGAGKTSFTKGLGKGLNVERVITSPTFTIIKEYVGRMTLYHIDAYRLEFSEEDLGLEEYILGEGVTVIEWAKFIEDVLPTEKLAIRIDYLANDKREIIFETEDNQIRKLVLELFEDIEGEE